MIVPIRRLRGISMVWRLSTVFAKPVVSNDLSDRLQSSQRCYLVVFEYGIDLCHPELHRTINPRCHLSDHRLNQFPVRCRSSHCNTQPFCSRLVVQEPAFRKKRASFRRSHPPRLCSPKIYSLSGAEPSRCCIIRGSRRLSSFCRLAFWSAVSTCIICDLTRAFSTIRSTMVCVCCAATERTLASSKAPLSSSCRSC